MADKENAAVGGKDTGKEGAAQNGAAAPPKPVERKLYTVKGPGSVIVGGQLVGAGTQLQLTADEAASLGDALMLGKPPPKDVVAERKAGKYEVAPNRNLWSGGEMRGAGFQLTLEAKEAQSLGDAVQPVVATQ